GFFVCSSTRARDRIARLACARISRHSSAVAWGIDVQARRVIAKRGGKGVAGMGDCDPRLSWFAYLRDADGEMRLSHARQLAYKSSQSIHFSRLPGNRIHEIAGTRTCLLICGEMLAGVHGRGR